MAPFYNMAPIENPFKYMGGVSYPTCYGARLGCKFHSIKTLHTVGLIDKKLAKNPGVSGIHRNPKQKELFNFTEGFLRAALIGHGQCSPSANS